MDKEGFFRRQETVRQQILIQDESETLPVIIPEPDINPDSKEGRKDEDW
jgi:hypothetical protein